MPDVSACTNKHCPLANRCYRATFIWGERQIVTCFQWKMVDGKAKCDKFVPTEVESVNRN